MGHIHNLCAVQGAMLESIAQFLVHSRPKHINGAESVLEMALECAVQECAKFQSASYRFVQAFAQEPIILAWAGVLQRQLAAVKLVKVGIKLLLQSTLKHIFRFLVMFCFDSLSA